MASALPLRVLFLLGFGCLLSSAAWDSCQSATAVSGFSSTALAGDWIPVKGYYTYCPTNLTININGNDLEYIRKFYNNNRKHMYNLQGATFTRSVDQNFIFAQVNRLTTQTVIAAGKNNPADTQYSYVLLQQCILKTISAFNRQIKVAYYQQPLLLSRDGNDPNVNTVDTLISGIEKRPFDIAFQTC